MRHHRRLLLEKGPARPPELTEVFRGLLPGGALYAISGPSFGLKSVNCSSSNLATERRSDHAQVFDPGFLYYGRNSGPRG